MAYWTSRAASSAAVDTRATSSASRVPTPSAITHSTRTCLTSPRESQVITTGDVRAPRARAPGMRARISSMATRARPARSTPCVTLDARITGTTPPARERDGRARHRLVDLVCSVACASPPWRALGGTRGNGDWRLVSSLVPLRGKIAPARARWDNNYMLLY